MNETPALIIERVCTQELARQLGIKPPSVYEWKVRRRIPAERVLEIERLTGISRHDLRPDVYGPAPENESSDAA